MADIMDRAKTLTRAEIPDPNHIITEEEVSSQAAGAVAYLFDATTKLKTWLPTQLQKNTEGVCLVARKASNILRRWEKDIPKAQELRKLAALSTRSVAIAMHNTKSRTDLALAIMTVAREEFSDLPELGAQIKADEQNLQHQYNVLKNAGKLPASTFSKVYSGKFLRDLGKAMEERDNYIAAMRYYRDAANQEYTPAKYDLGRLYMAGKGAEKDEKAACEFFCLAAKEGYSPAMVELYRCCENGLGVEKAPDLALGWLKRAVDAGETSAANQMGMRYLKGQGVPRDPAEAARWIRKGAEHGDKDAMWNLASLYENGLGVEKDRNQALSWYDKAGTQGHPEAGFMAAMMYEKEKNDPEKARTHYLRSGKAGNIHACREAARMLSQGQGGPMDLKGTLEMRKKVVELGGTGAEDYLALGLAHQQLATDQDYQEARKCYQQAQQKGSPEAAQRLQMVDKLIEGRILAAKQKKKKKVVGGLIAAAAVVVLVFVGTLVCLFAGKSALDKGDYETAYNLLSIGRIYDQNAYRDAQFRRGVQLLNQYDFEGAYRLLENSGRTDSPEYCYANGMYILMEKAGASADVEGTLDLAAQNFEKAGDCGDASEYLEILNRIEAGQISCAMELALEQDPNQTGQLLLSDWSEILLRLETEDNARKELLKGCMEAWTQRRTGAPTRDEVDDIHGTTASAMTGWSPYYVSEISDFDAFMDQCGTAPADKVLILRAYHGYKDTELTYSVDLSFMEHLPARFYPGTLAEVAYVVVVEYDYRDSPTGDYGWGYGATTQGLQEIGQVYVMNVRSGRTIYESGLVIGADSPQSFTYSGAAPAYKTGGSPDLSDEAYEALQTIPGLMD